jgi:uncharacterized membrane protein YkoI
MLVLRAFIILCLVGVLAAPARAADSFPARGACLNKAEQRAVVAARRAVPLAEAIKNLRTRGHWGEVVRARLCRRGEGLVYVLTLLARNGKVVSLAVDAANGELINGR